MRGGVIAWTAMGRAYCAPAPLDDRWPAWRGSAGDIASALLYAHLAALMTAARHVPARSAGPSWQRS
jgi:hypothetical protein